MFVKVEAINKHTAFLDTERAEIINRWDHEDSYKIGKLVLIEDMAICTHHDPLDPGPDDPFSLDERYCDPRQGQKEVQGYCHEARP